MRGFLVGCAFITLGLLFYYLSDLADADGVGPVGVVLVIISIGLVIYGFVVMIRPKHRQTKK